MSEPNLKNFEVFWQKLEEILKSYESSATVFNQYRDEDCNPDLDVPLAAQIRRTNLRNYLEQATTHATILVVGEAAGPWGCRFSGVPFTGEQQLLVPAFPFHGAQSSRPVPARPVGKNPPYISNTAKMFWKVMLPYHNHTRFVVWDAFPLHPHKPDDKLSVRTPGESEVAEFKEAIGLLLDYIKPKEIIAVGNKAYEELDNPVFKRNLAELGISLVRVRHPSHGGKAEFEKGMRQHFESEQAGR